MSANIFRDGDTENKIDYAGNIFVLFGLVASVIWLVYVSFVD